MTILRLTGLLEAEDERAMVLEVFSAYLDVCRRLQAVYNLEPAGSKGVWGLDDHQFLSYYFGSAQFDPSTSIPRLILDRKSLEPLASTNLFASSVLHVHRLKRGPFNEHSPMLYSIATTVPNWNKANSGLLKAWKGEVLSKWPVVQHLYFGRYLPWRAAHGPTGVDDGGADLPISAPVQQQTSEPSAATMAPWAMPSVEAGTRAPWAQPGLADRSGLSSRR